VLQCQFKRPGFFGSLLKEKTRLDERPQDQRQLRECTGQHRPANRCVSTVSQLSDKWTLGGPKPSSARTGTGALIAQTMLTMLTQNSRACGGKEIAAARSKFDHNQAMTIWLRALCRKASDDSRCRSAAIHHRTRFTAWR